MALKKLTPINEALTKQGDVYPIIQSPSVQSKRAQAPRTQASSRPSRSTRVKAGQLANRKAKAYLYGNIKYISTLILEFKGYENVVYLCIISVHLYTEGYFTVNERFVLNPFNIRIYNIRN